MTIKGTVRIGTQTYKIIVTNEIDGELSAEIDYVKKTIKIRPDDTNEYGFDHCLYHEIAHGLVYEHTFNSKMYSNEPLINFIAELLQKQNDYYKIKLK